MTDYDPIRTCCSKADICKRCWGFISAAVRILDNGIRNQFGYEKLLWVYSGRRGIHLWISDEEAMALTDDQRKALVEHMSIPFSEDMASKKLNIRNGYGRSLPPPLQEASDVLRHVFTTLVLLDQDCFRSEEGSEKLLQWIRDEAADTLRDRWSNDPNRSSMDKWEDFRAIVASIRKDSSRRIALSNAMEDIVLQYTYPRLDVEVSKHRNHLLKAPFCVHPKTGRVCVPVDPAKIDDFDPEAVPTVGQLLGELDAISKDDDGMGEHHSDWEKTSLKSYVEMFNQHATRLMDEARRLKRETDVSW
ncbi:hypothetical protein AX14_003707 [Amanita brunnescens Koide BX004]|nr:hypothetical protein AX14_003707 [Amanita brunnescens Koide BX004]